MVQATPKEDNLFSALTLLVGWQEGQGHPACEKRAQESHLFPFRGFRLTWNKSGKNRYIKEKNN